MTTVIQIILIVEGLFCLSQILKRDLMMLQLNSYRNDRYTKWFNSSNESTNYLRIGGCISLFLILVHHLPFVVTGAVAIVILAWITFSLLRAKYKKPLVFTKRAVRIYLTMSIVCLLAVALTGLLSSSLYNAIGVALSLIVISPVVLLMTNLMLSPVEKHINGKYYRDAARILSEMPDLRVVGITGSYGKTSTKHYLNRILSEKYDVMMTPGSYNTTLGVVRTIREHLKPYNEVFIVEMGAKQPGDIKEICDLVHPEIGIVTAVGEQHLESFKTIGNIQKTKFELIDSLPAGGLGVINDDSPMIANREVPNVKCIRYGIKNRGAADYVATDMATDETGTTFTVTGGGKTLKLHTKLVGECNVSNLLAAIAVAISLDVEDEKIAYAVSKIEQVEHRLNMKRTAGGVTIIDDAFNSNPEGAKMALDVLGSMKGGQRIVVTPGMVELGDRQAELNNQLGRNIAESADVAIIVGEYNQASILAGLAESGYPEDKTYCALTFKDAQSILAGIIKKGDIVLYENDLPDTYK